MATATLDEMKKHIASKKGTRIPVSLRATTFRSHPEIVGVISAGALVHQYEIPRRDHKTKTGYQREVAVARVNRLVEDLKKRRVDLPTAVLLNLRDFEARTDLVREGDRYWFDPGDKRLFVVDGQHRIEALKRLVDERPEEWSTFEISFACMLGASESEEMQDFYVVNSTAKSVRTDLALDLLKQRAEQDPAIMEALFERGESWKVEAQTITEELAKGAPWRNCVRFPGQDKGNTTIGSASLVGSLQPILNNQYFSMIQSTHRVQILQAYWKGIQQVLPEAFEDPNDYVLQKFVGAQVMNRVLGAVIEYLRSTGKSLIEPNSYAEAIAEALQELEGDNRDGEVVKGVDFWKAGATGAAGSFSSNAGRRVLTAKIQAKLRPPLVE